MPNRKSRHLHSVHRVQGKLFLDNIVLENEWESVQHDQQKQKTNNLTTAFILHTLQFISLNDMLTCST